MLTTLHEYRGRQEFYIETQADSLDSLLEIAKIQSTGASNRIEGIYTTDKRLEELVRDKTAPRSRSEQEIAGYRDVLATIHESHNFIMPRPNIILQLHKQLYSFSTGAAGGVYKNADNLIAETDPSGNEFVRFRPLPAFLTPGAMDELCASFLRELERGEHDALLLIPLFILDFLCIHPFTDGNGRMSRLLTLLLFYRAGYVVGKYISIEKLIEESKETYYEALQVSSAGWHEAQNDYLPFIRYYLGVLLKAYHNFEDRLAYLGPALQGRRNRKLSKPERIKTFIEKTPGRITKKDILIACPDISQVTVERTLAELVKTGVLAKIGAGRTAAYAKKENIG
jgi:Fic family protein